MQPITQKVVKISTPNLEYFLNMTRCSCKTRGITLKAILLELCHFLNKIFKQNDGPSQTRALVLHVVLLFRLMLSPSLFNCYIFILMMLNWFILQQYSACLVQYKTDSFGGFKKQEVMKEIKRGSRLVCLSLSLSY